jgi:hypothetical protein
MIRAFREHVYRLGLSDVVQNKANQLLLSLLSGLGFFETIFPTLTSCPNNFMRKNPCKIMLQDANVVLAYSMFAVALQIILILVSTRREKLRAVLLALD